MINSNMCYKIQTFSATSSIVTFHSDDRIGEAITETQNKANLLAERFIESQPPLPRSPSGNHLCRWSMGESTFSHSSESETLRLIASRDVKLIPVESLASKED